MGQQWVHFRNLLDQNATRLERLEHRLPTAAAPSRRTKIILASLGQAIWPGMVAKARRKRAHSVLRMLRLWGGRTWPLWAMGSLWPNWALRATIVKPGSDAMVTVRRSVMASLATAQAKANMAINASEPMPNVRS
jgi:hypothetical protein